MNTEIIQHHEPVDFEKFYETSKTNYIDIDYQDFTTFMNRDGEKHSFIGRGAGKDRIKNALEDAIGSDEAQEIVSRATSVMITIVRNPDAEQPLMVTELQYVNEFLSRFPSDCDLVWGLSDDSSLGNDVKIIILANS